MLTWKSVAPFDPGEHARFAREIVALIGAWSGGVYDPRTWITCPPQGASAPGPYAAEALARAVADVLGFPYLDTLARTGQKRYHHPMESRRQPPYICVLPRKPPGMILVVDDLVTSGTTMRLSLTAIRSAGVPAFGFSYA
jgi:hypothetical protein